MEKQFHGLKQNNMNNKKSAEKILEQYFPLVIADEDEWAVHVVKAMQEYAKLKAFESWVAAMVGIYQIPVDKKQFEKWWEKNQ